MRRRRRRSKKEADNTEILNIHIDINDTVRYTLTRSKAEAHLLGLYLGAPHRIRRITHKIKGTLDIASRLVLL